MIIIILVLYSFLAIYDLVPLYKQKYWYDFWVNLTLEVFSLFVAILISSDVNIPSPETPIREIITAIFGK